MRRVKMGRVKMVASKHGLGQDGSGQNGSGQDVDRVETWVKLGLIRTGRVKTWGGSRRVGSR